MTAPRGVGDTAPLQYNPQGFSLPQTSAAAWGQAALHPTLPHSVGRPSPATHSRHPVGAGHARPATLPLPPRILCIVGRQATGPLHNRPALSNTKITCPRPLAGRSDCRKRCAHPLAPSARGLRPQAVGERTVRLSEIFRAMARFSPSAPSGHRSPSGASATSPVSGESVSQREAFRQPEPLQRQDI